MQKEGILLAAVFLLLLSVKRGRILEVAVIAMPNISRTVLVGILLLVALDDVGKVARVDHLQVFLKRLSLLKSVEDQRELVALEQLGRHCLALRVILGRREEWIDCDFECILDHVGNDPCEKRAAEFQTRIVVDFNQPSIEILINHEVQPEDLKSKLPIA